jgi:branched-chain amino acid transport system ATP-binding protein
MVQTVFKIVEDIKKQGITVLLVEQNVKHSLKVSDRGYVLETGRLVMEGTGDKLLNDEYLKKAYLGI